jgi:hypothetical protein
MARIGMWRVERGERRIGNTRTQRHVRAPGIVMEYPQFQDAPQMQFRQGNQPIQALATNRADHSFADGIHLSAAVARRSRKAKPVSAIRSVNSRRTIWNSAITDSQCYIGFALASTGAIE